MSNIIFQMIGIDTFDIRYIRKYNNDTNSSLSMIRQLRTVPRITDKY